jgi:hypothetical protein
MIAVGLHWLSELWHQKGHARAAKRTGYPMEARPIAAGALLDLAMFE